MAVTFSTQTEALSRKVADLHALALPMHTEAVQKEMDGIYGEMERLELKVGLVNEQLKNENKPTLTIDLLKRNVAQLHNHLIVDGIVRPLEDQSTALMMKLLKKTEPEQKNSIEELKSSWKRMSQQMKNLHHEVSVRKLQLEEDIRITVSTLDIQLHQMKVNLANLSQFYREPLVVLIERLGLLGTKELEDLFSLLDQEFLNRLDYYIYELSPQPKGGHEWGKRHRLTDRVVLKKALGLAVLTHVEGQKLTEKEWKMMMRKISSCGGGPREKHEAIICGQQNASSHPLLVCKAWWLLTNQEAFQKLFYGTKRPTETVRGFTLKAPASKEQNALEKIREKLLFTVEEPEVEESAKKAYMSGSLDTLSISDRHMIEGKVYFYSKDPKKGGPNWGRDHAYDDLNVLLKAIDEVIRLRRP